MASISKARSHREVLAVYRAQYEADIESGKVAPITYPMISYGFAIGLIFLLVTPNSAWHNSLTRWAVFLAIAYWQVWIIASCNASNPSTSFGIGLTGAFILLWSTVLFVFKDSKVDFKRVQQYRSEVDGRISGSFDHNGKAENRAESRFFWEAYPETSSFAKRLDWACDVYTNARGVGWNYQLNCLPTLPQFVQLQLLSTSPPDSPPPVDIRVSRSGYQRFDEYWACLRHHAWLLAKGYLVADVLKTVMHHDPFFWGLVERRPPCYFPFDLVCNSWLLTRSYRLLVCMTFIWAGLRNCFTLGPLLFLGVLTPLVSPKSPLPTSWKRHLSQACRMEPWLFPDHNGSYMVVLDKGLAGWWGGWWHQIFRYSFQAGAEFVQSSLGLRSSSMVGQLVGVFVAFALSGALHACGSYTQQGDTKPLRGPMLFFLLQAVGVMSESLFRHAVLRRFGLTGKMPKWLSRMVILVWVNAWLFLTAPLLVDDFAKGGLWLLEPLMISPTRGLGLGVEGDGWYCWEGTWATWYRDKRRWWLSGIAL